MLQENGGSCFSATFWVLFGLPRYNPVNLT
uniref:Uncharacterized protein n=1 Tax=Anguilla anguilla TaxID=7936 RepID=A0A0E9X7J5_ANGAN